MFNFSELFGAIIQLLIGWFVTVKMCDVVGAKGLLATIIKIVGVIILISGFISLAHCFFRF